MIITALKMNNKRLNKKEKLRHFNKLKKKVSNHETGFNMNLNNLK